MINQCIDKIVNYVKKIMIACDYKMLCEYNQAFNVVLIKDILQDE